MKRVKSAQPRKRVLNKAVIRVTYPDGCRHTQETRPDADIASDAAAFGRWLVEAGEEIIERATTDGQCARKSEIPHVERDPTGGKAMIRVVQFSGGKDSTALVLWALEQFGETGFLPMFCDTGWEHPITLAYIEHINRRLLLGRLVVLKSERYDGMVELVRLKKRVPSAKARFCTDELKTEPSVQYVRQLLVCDDVTVYQGIRADESKKRKDDGPRFFSDRYDCWIERPLYDWTAEQIFDLHHQHGVEPNPLYKMGAGRVGCFPCVQVNHADLKRMTETIPEIWDRMAELEAAAAGRTFFPPNYIPARFCSRVAVTEDGRHVRIPTLEDVRAYVTQPNQPDFWDDEPRTCMSVYNQCE